MEQVKGLWRSLLQPGLLGVAIGCAVGGVDAVFGRVLLRLSAVRDAHVLPLVLLLPLGGVLIAWAYRTVGRGTERGMGLVFEAGRGEAAEIPLRLIPLIMGGTWLTHLLGGSAGREGVAVQIGAAVGHGVGRRTGGNGKVFLIAGMAAGFSGLFRTPIAAVFFALEVMTAGALEYAALFPAMTASFTACAVSGALGLEKFQAAVSAPAGLNAGGAAVLLVAGILFGVTGGLFARVLAAAKGWAAKALPNSLARIAALGGAAALLLMLCGRGRYAGLGTNLIAQATGGGTIFWFDFLLKFLLTVLTLAAGFQGGEVTPLFAVGASLGAALGPLVGVDPAFLAALGYAAVFGGATNTLLAPMLIGGEVFGFENLPRFFLVCALAYLCNGSRSIYTAQRKLAQ
ncbi:voltage-gated chloride channel protein [Pseudoflavonifractor sp. BIOML-A14]|nr:voltage-gated chloride channel protein [Pseudoflavonifractor sp. BIOML-A14]